MKNNYIIKSNNLDKYNYDENYQQLIKVHLIKGKVLVRKIIQKTKKENITKKTKASIIY